MCASFHFSFHCISLHSSPPSFPLLPPSPSLEGVGLLTEAIDACFSSHPLDEEEAVQAGLTRWSGGQGRQPPTWDVLISAMEYAKIAQQHIEDLKKELHEEPEPATVKGECGVAVCLSML